MTRHSPEVMAVDQVLERERLSSYTVQRHMMSGVFPVAVSGSRR